MSHRSNLALLLGFFFILGATEATAQAFFPSKVNGTFQVRFSSNAQGVQVSIDGQPAGVIPLTVWVTPGVHQFSFTAPGSETRTVPYPVKGDTEVPYMVSQKSFQLTVNTNVPGATLAVDGQPFAGNTVSVAAGNHTLTVSAPGYQSVTLPFQQPASANVLNVTLVASTFPLTVNTNVPGASLAVDGQAVAGNTTSVTAGNHTLTVSAPGYQSVTLPFQQPASSNILNVTLIASTFPLTVNTNVPGATLAVDGRTFAGSTTSVTAGNHTLTVSAPGYQAISLPFQQPASSNILNVTLIASTFPLTVNTNVPGASLAVDGQPFVGNTTSVTAGNHTLTVSAPGYQSVTLPFQQPASANILNVTLVSLTATVTLSTDKLFKAGTAFKVYVNNAEAKGTVLTLNPGTYLIRVASSTVSVETTITVTAAQNLVLEPMVVWQTR